MKAIVTKALGPTNSRGSRIKATYDPKGKPLTVAWDYALGPTENHERAAVMLANRLDWLTGGYRLQSGSLPNGDYAHVLVKKC